MGKLKKERLYFIMLYTQAEIKRQETAVSDLSTESTHISAEKDVGMEASPLYYDHVRPMNTQRHPTDWKNLKRN